MDLITGSTGFIGGHLARRLISEGRDIRILCRSESLHKLDPHIARNSEIVFGDLRNESSIDKALIGVERVFHCAGQVADWGRESDFYQLNVQGTQWLLEAALKAQVNRFVHLSSIAVFGVPSPTYFDDNTPYGSGKDFYSKTKIEAEKEVFRMHQKSGLPITILRPSVVYGPYSTWVEEPLRMIQRNKLFLIGKGKGVCHPCYIENLIDALLLAADHRDAIGQAYIIGDNESISFQEYFNYLAEIAGKKQIQKSIPIPVARAMATTLETAARLRRSLSRPLLTHTAIDMVCTSSRMSMEKIRTDLQYRPRFETKAAMMELRQFYQTDDSLERKRLS